MKLPDPMEKPELFYALAARRHARGLAVLPPPHDHRVTTERHIEMLRLRLLEGLTLREVGARVGWTGERVRQLLIFYFDVEGVPPAAKARRRAR